APEADEQILRLGDQLALRVVARTKFSIDEDHGRIAHDSSSSICITSASSKRGLLVSVKQTLSTTVICAALNAPYVGSPLSVNFTPSNPESSNTSRIACAPSVPNIMRGSFQKSCGE